jgi:uncharacterized protein involved in exopolysaccharide biosynthesis
MTEAAAVLETIRRGWWAGALVLVTTLAATSAFTSRQAPVYRSTGTIVVKPDPALLETVDVLRSLEVLERRTILATFAELAVSARVKAAAAGLADLGAVDAAQFRVASSIVPNTNVLRISVEGPEAQAVASLARHVGAVLATESQHLYTPFLLEPLSEAAPAPRASFPDPRRNFIVGIVAGLFLGVAATLMAARLGPRRAQAALNAPARAYAAR